MNTVLITGGSGFIGKNLRRQWQGRYTLLAPSHAELELTDQRSVDAFFAENAVDFVIHCAIKPGHRAAADPTGLLDADLRMYYNLQRNVEPRSIKMFVIGSGCCYGMEHYTPRMPETYMGTHIPRDETGFAKYITSLDILHSEKIYDLRVFGIFGPHEDYTIRFISNAICKAIAGFPITLRQDRRFDYIYIDDFVALLDQMMHAPLRHHAYNITSDQTASLLQLAEWVKEITRADVPIQVATPGRGVEYSGDNRRLRREFPHFSFRSYREGIAQLVQFYRGHARDLDFDALSVDP